MLMLFKRTYQLTKNWLAGRQAKMNATPASRTQQHQQFACSSYSLAANAWKKQR